MDYLYHRGLFPVLTQRKETNVNNAFKDALEAVKNATGYESIDERDRVFAAAGILLAGAMLPMRVRGGGVISSVYGECEGSVWNWRVGDGGITRLVEEVPGWVSVYKGENLIGRENLKFVHSVAYKEIADGN